MQNYLEFEINSLSVEDSLPWTTGPIYQKPTARMYTITRISCNVLSQANLVVVGQPNRSEATKLSAFCRNKLVEIIFS
jgi:hypothetical protein